MGAFFSGFFSVFVPQFVPTGCVSLFDPDEGAFVIEPAGEILAHPTLAVAWEKVGKHLQTAITDYEHHAAQ